MNDSEKLLVLRIVVTYLREQRHAYWRGFLESKHGVKLTRFTALDIAMAYRQAQMESMVCMEMDNPHADR